MMGRERTRSRVDKTRKRPYTEHECIIAFHEPIGEFRYSVGDEENRAQRM